MLTRAELAAIRAILETHYGWGHHLTQRIHEEWKATPPEPPKRENQPCEQ